MRVKLILHVIVYLPGDHAKVASWKEHDATFIIKLLRNLRRFRCLYEDVHLKLKEARASHNLLFWCLVGDGYREVDTLKVKFLPRTHSEEDVLLPLAFRDLLHDGASQPGKQLRANYFFQALKIVCLHLILVVFVEDMPLECL